jgi:soluble lytic murein transglycosylase-like protein
VTSLVALGLALALSSAKPGGPPEAVFFEFPRSVVLPSAAVQAAPPPKNPSLHGRRSAAFERTASFIAEERFDEALAFARRQPRELRDWAGLAALEAGLISAAQPAEALEIYYRVINGPVRDRHWARALAGYRLTLRKLSERGDYAARGRLIRCLGLEWRNAEARALLAATLAETGLPEAVRDELSAYGAVLALRLGDFSAAEAFWLNRRDEASRRWLSVLRLRQGRFAESAEARLAAAENLTGTRRLRDLERAFDALVKGGLHGQAAKALADNPELKRRLPDWSFRLGLAALAGAEPAKARPHFEDEAKRSGGRLAAAQYYLGRAAELEGRPDEARRHFRQAAVGRLSYYRLLAEGRLAALEGFVGRSPTAEPLARLLDDPGDGGLGRHLWLTERLPWPWPSGPPEAKTSAGRGDLDRARAAVEHWLAAGDEPAALAELAAYGETLLPARTPGADPFAAACVLLAARGGRPGLAVRLLGRLATPRDGGDRWNHPLALSPQVLRAWRSHGLSPQLTLSVVRAESAFEAEAVSTSNARGLMQLLPATAERLASLAGEAKPREEALFEPDLNMRYGTSYLSSLLQGFGNPALALAAYNGGPFNIATYMEALPDRPLDLFIDTLPFAESSNYVKKVLESVAVYESAYLGRYNVLDFSRPVGRPPGPTPDF